MIGRTHSRATSNHTRRLHIVDDPFVDAGLAVLWADGAAGSANDALGRSDLLLL
jgi:hypothetical protein